MHKEKAGGGGGGGGGEVEERWEKTYENQWMRLEEVMEEVMEEEGWRMEGKNYGWMRCGGKGRTREREFR